MNTFTEKVLSLTRSIRFRLATWFVVILAIVLVVFSFFIYTRQVQVLRTLAVARLDLKIRRLTGQDRFSERTRMRMMDNTSASMAELQEDDALVFLDAQGRSIQNTGPLEDRFAERLLQRRLERIQNPDDALNWVFFARAGGIPARLFNQTYVFTLGLALFDGRQGGYYLLGSPVDPDGQLPRLALSLVLGTLVMLAAAWAGGFWLADRAISPVKRITQAARQIGATDLNRRINLGSKDELGELADTFDDMLARLQAAFERQRQFTADASHELRTPLTIVELEASRALSAARSPQEYVRVLTVIQSENQLMSRLVNNLLTLARMDAGQVVLDMQPLDLSEVALEVLERLQPLAEKKGVQICPGELAELVVSGDRQYLVQMVSNLVENAIKYTGGEVPRVEVSCREYRTDRGTAAQLQVIDHGPGIPAEHLPHLFDRFYQVDQARTRNPGEEAEPGEQELAGAGLGLSIVQWIVQAHGGEIQVQSEPATGTTFTVLLPLSARRSD